MATIVFILNAKPEIENNQFAIIVNQCGDGMCNKAQQQQAEYETEKLLNGLRRKTHHIHYERHRLELNGKVSVVLPSLFGDATSFISNVPPAKLRVEIGEAIPVDDSHTHVKMVEEAARNVNAKEMEQTTAHHQR